MGDHFGFVDPGHPSDETPLHRVELDSFFIARTETTTASFCDFLNDVYHEKLIVVSAGEVRLVEDSSLICYTHQYASYYSLELDNDTFRITDFRALHPMVGVMWKGAALYCNWRSKRSGLDTCYSQSTWKCDRFRSGYRLPTEAEWEYAARGGHTDPYFNYPWGNDRDFHRANWPQSGDPYESGDLPQTTPVAFYDGSNRQKQDFGWPGLMLMYQTHDGSNSFGLFDMAGNVWEFVQDWYAQDYYSRSPVSNPQGPDVGFIMPDGLTYRGMRGGNWYNGYLIDSVNDGHSRVSNRNPSYYRGPQDPTHPWYHVGFRVARTFIPTTGLDGDAEYLSATANSSCPYRLQISQNASGSEVTVTMYSAHPAVFTCFIHDVLGRRVASFNGSTMQSHDSVLRWETADDPIGVYFCTVCVNGTVLCEQFLLHH